jgi:hypothetical protein
LKRKLSVYKNLNGCIITEMYDDKTEQHYFTAVILGWNGFKFTSRQLKPNDLFMKTLRMVRYIRGKIKEDESIINILPHGFIFEDLRFLMTLGLKN